MKISKKRYLQGFALCVVLLGMVRCVFPDVAGDRAAKDISSPNNHLDSLTQKGKSHEDHAVKSVAANNPEARPSMRSKFFNADGSLVKNRIYSVQNFSKSFPDQNDVQLIAANKLGVKPVLDRAEAESRKAELVYIGANPYFYVDRLKSSIPYLVPQAAVLLQDIGRNFFDSLQVKGIPLHKIIITSVMRSREDIERLRGHNGNAKSNSCHLYGTTFDIGYNRYITVQDPDGPARRQVRNDSLKWVLSEVLNDLRNLNRCYVKYEIHQGCFHVTTR